MAITIYRYAVMLTDAETGKARLIDTISFCNPISGDNYTAEDYRMECRGNGVEWPEGEITFTEIE